MKLRPRSGPIIPNEGMRREARVLLSRDYTHRTIGGSSGNDRVNYSSLIGISSDARLMPTDRSLNALIDCYSPVAFHSTSLRHTSAIRIAARTKFWFREGRTPDSRSRPWSPAAQLSPPSSHEWAFVRRRPLCPLAKTLLCLVFLSHRCARYRFSALINCRVLSPCVSSDPPVIVFRMFVGSPAYIHVGNEVLNAKGK